MANYLYTIMNLTEIIVIIISGVKKDNLVKLKFLILYAFLTI